MPQPARKPPTKKPSAAVAARREVRAEKGKPAPVKVLFRKATFEIPRDRLGSARVLMRMQNLQRHPTVAAELDVLFEILGQVDSGRFIDLCVPGDDIETVFNQFVAALNKAANVPNS